MNPQQCGFSGVGTLISRLIYQTTQTASSKHPTLVLSAGPATATPQPGDQQGYVSPLVDLYLEWDSDLEALYEDSPAFRKPVSYEDILDAPSGSEVESETRVTERQFMQLDLI